MPCVKAMDSNILRSVYLHLGRRDLLALACTSSSVARVLSDPFIWKSHLEKHEGGKIIDRSGFNWKRIYLLAGSSERYPEGCYTKCLADLEALQVYIELQEERWKRAVRRPDILFGHIKSKQVLDFVLDLFQEDWYKYIGNTIVSALQRDDIALFEYCLDLLKKRKRVPSKGIWSWKWIVSRESESIIRRVPLRVIAKLDKELVRRIASVPLGWRIAKEGAWDITEGLIEKNKYIVSGILRYGLIEADTSVAQRMLPWMASPEFSQYTIASCCKLAMQAGDANLLSHLLPLLRVHRIIGELAECVRYNINKNRREIVTVMAKHLPSKLIYQELATVVDGILHWRVICARSNTEGRRFFNPEDNDIELVEGLLLGCDTDELPERLVYNLCELMKLGDSLTELCLSDTLVRYLCFKRPDDAAIVKWLRESTHPAAVEAIDAIIESRPVRFSDALPYRALLQFTAEKSEMEEILAHFEEATQYGLYKANLVLSLLTWLREDTTSKYN